MKTFTHFGTHYWEIADIREDNSFNSFTALYYFKLVYKTISTMPTKIKLTTKFLKMIEKSKHVLNV